MRRLLALINPIAGSGNAAALWTQVAQHLESRGADIEDVAALHTEGQQHATAAAKEAARAGWCVVAVGGDGLVRDVAAGVSAAASESTASNVMAIVAAGRGNDLVRRLDLPREPREIAEALMTGTASPIDLLDVNGAVVVGNAYVGVDAVAARMINSARWVPDVVIYRGAGVAAVARWRKTTFRLQYDNASGEFVDRRVAAHDIVIANSGQYGHGLEIVPSARIDDGWIDVLVVKHGSPFRVGSFLLAAQKGAHVARNDVEVFQTRSISIEADRAVPFGADGDEVTQLPATVTLLPHAVELVGFSGNNPPP